MTKAGAAERALTSTQLFEILEIRLHTIDALPAQAKTRPSVAGHRVACNTKHEPFHDPPGLRTRFQERP
eukprot:scaffold1366_cov233-Pinguiococcus_pyrenoidosus.AAC.6